MPEFIVPPNSFTFGIRNSLTEWGMKVIAYDVFSPPKRERAQLIPRRHGQYDYGDNYYDTRIINLECNIERVMTKAERREASYWLTRKNQLRLWDEPDKYYICEIMDSSRIDVFSKYVKQKFTLSFVCYDPFAHGEVVTLNLGDYAENVYYKGTIQTPTIIRIKNNNKTAVSGIMITSLRDRTAE